MSFVAHLARALALAACLAWAASAHATSVLPLYLDELIDTSAVAFEATCTQNRSGRDPATGLVVTFTTFEVHDLLKGAAGSTYTIKQIGGTVAEENLTYRVTGVPRYRVGERYVLFLTAVSSIGFSSPIGLEQGRFTVDTSNGAATVRNGRDFRELTARMSLPASTKSKLQLSPEPVRDMDLEQFKQLVRARTGARR
jgi:hypothetical protein